MSRERKSGAVPATLATGGVVTEKQPDPAHGVEHKPHGDGLTPEVRALREERRTESFYDAQITYRKSIPALRPEVAA